MFGITVALTYTESAMTTDSVRNTTRPDMYLRHYWRIAKLYTGPGMSDWRNAGERRVDEAGIKATVKLREIFRNEPKPGLIEVLAFTGKRWASGWAMFEERVQTLGSTYSWGALTARQAA